MSFSSSQQFLLLVAGLGVFARDLLAVISRSYGECVCHCLRDIAPSVPQSGYLTDSVLS